ncbi:HEAT repeat domain-containing protein [Sphingobacterium suaedae]|uniref:HEAT repeat domain-containing protein n=1 Tax=Sphingobacterium suaedae TaxID=1686402 RepID=A0ABW5KL59_9SPHI
MLQRITIHELIIAIVIVLILVLLLIIFVLFYSFHKYKILHDRQVWTQMIEQKVTEAIVEGNAVVRSDTLFRKFLQEPSFRSVFLAVLVASERKFSGGARTEVNQLFHTFQLEEEAWRKIRQRKAYLIAGGIQELTAMGVKDAISDIAKFVHHADRQIYQEAQYALVRFNGFDGLLFLDTVTRPLSDWQQLRLLRSIEGIPDEHLNRLSGWISSSNESVVVFSLRLMRKFRLLTFYDQVLTLLTHAKTTVRVQAVRTLQALENAATVGQLIDLFPEQSEEVQLEILRALKFSRSRLSIPFLQRQLVEHAFVSIKISAAEILVSLGQQTYLRDMAANDATPPQLIHIIKHALQEKTW